MIPRRAGRSLSRNQRHPALVMHGRPSHGGVSATNQATTILEIEQKGEVLLVKLAIELHDLDELALEASRRRCSTDWLESGLSCEVARANWTAFSPGNYKGKQRESIYYPRQMVLPDSF